MNNAKGNVIIAALTFIALALAAAGALYLWQTRQNPPTTPPSTVTTPSETAAPAESETTARPPTVVSPTPSTTNTETDGWKAYDSPCGFSLRYPSDWKAQKFFVQDSNDACAYLTAPDYKQGLDTREGFHLDISRTLIGRTAKTVIINSLDNYIKSLENISEPPTPAENVTDKVFGIYQGKQFDLGLFEFQTIFAFTKGKYIYVLVWPRDYTGAHKRSLDQILATFRFD